MNAKAEQPGRFDGLKWAVVAALVTAGIVGNTLYDDQSLLYRVLALTAMALVAAWIAVQTERGQAFWQLAKDARVEIRRVVWPTREESTQTTLIVVVFVLIVALLLWALDTGLGWLAAKIIG